MKASELLKKEHTLIVNHISHFCALNSWFENKKNSAVKKKKKRRRKTTLA